jgi:alginate O-acetyltransferase complex protein AlgI
MLFDSPVYILFLILIVIVYWRLDFRKQNLFLLVASYFFYGWWDWRFLLLMIGSTAIDYLVAREIYLAQVSRSRRMWLLFSLIVNFSILGIFKYCNFFIDSFAQALHLLGANGIPRHVLQIVLPPGISFYTFQEVAYIADIYKGKLKPADSFIQYSLFISLFPHLIAGPIQRPSHLLPQVQAPRVWKSEKVFDGLMLIMEGLFRKCVIADNCALIANAAFEGHFGPPTLPVLLLGMYAFAWQIYGDFSGYSSIARGSAQLLGFHFMVNFRQPYLAETLQDFWRRWHISLSTWLRDYLYIGLGGNRSGKVQTFRNLMLTMLLGGLWHGANWTFVIWGGIHGTGLAAGRMAPHHEPSANRTPAWIWIRRVIVFHVACVAWLFFRAATPRAAFAMLNGIGVWLWRPEFLVAFQFLAVFSLPLLLVDLMLDKSGDEYIFQTRPFPTRVAIGVASAAVILLFGANQANAFIYFQF